MSPQSHAPVMLKAHESLDPTTAFIWSFKEISKVKAQFDKGRKAVSNATIKLASLLNTTTATLSRTTPKAIENMHD